MKEKLNVDELISAYTQGFFPMAERDGIYWHSPDPRAIIPFENIPSKPKSLTKSERKHNFKHTIDYNFEYVITECSKRKDTWISPDIINSFTELNIIGFAHSIETWKEGKIVGGLYGVCIGAAFFGESMFNTVDDAAKSAYFYLIELLNRNNFLLLDSQYINPFTEKLGAIEIPKQTYLNKLYFAISQVREFR
jgi:leucyl/phenylalanyl-tRNA---protein transferase